MIQRNSTTTPVQTLKYFLQNKFRIFKEHRLTESVVDIVVLEFSFHIHIKCEVHVLPCSTFLNTSLGSIPSRFPNI